MEERTDSADGSTGLTIAVATASPVDHDVDLVAVGVVASRTGQPLHGTIAVLDRLLGGAIECMRVESGPNARAGDATRIDGAPGVVAPRILLVGLGPAASLGPDALAVAARVAVESAIDLGARTVGFAPGLLDAGVVLLKVDDVARAVARGAREGYDARARATPRRLDFYLESSSASRDMALRALRS